jgi:hypothetical protein
MWIVFAMASFGLGYAIFASVRRNDPAAGFPCTSPRVSRPHAGKESSSCSTRDDLKSVTFVSVDELREMLRTSSSLLLLEVHEASNISRTTGVIPGALCISLDRLAELMAWVPPTESVVLYAVGASNDKLIRTLESFSHRRKVSVLRGGSNAWESGAHATVQAA